MNPLQTTRGKNAPNIVFMQKCNYELRHIIGQHKTLNRLATWTPLSTSADTHVRAKQRY